MKYIMRGWKILDGLLHWKCSAYLLLSIVSSEFISCKLNSKQEIVEEQSKPEDLNILRFNQLPINFQEFYVKFHADSLFQMEHIVFPVKGLPNQADPDDVKEGDFYFTADQWELHKSFDPTINDLYYLNLGDIIIEERVLEKKYNLMTIRRFAKASGGWRLIYYAGLNKYKINK